MLNTTYPGEAMMVRILCALYGGKRFTHVAVNRYSAGLRRMNELKIAKLCWNATAKTCKAIE